MYQKYHDAPVPYPTMHHSVTEMRTCVHFCCKMTHYWIFVWCIMGFMRWNYSDHWHSITGSDNIVWPAVFASSCGMPAYITCDPCFYGMRFRCIESVKTEIHCLISEIMWILRAARWHISCTRRSLFVHSEQRFLNAPHLWQRFLF